MEFFDLVMDMEKQTVQNYKNLAEQCANHEGIRNILLMLADDHERHSLSLASLKDRSSAAMEGTQAFREVRRIFEQMKLGKDTFSCDIDQLGLYKQALELVEKKRHVYSDMMEKAESQEERRLLEKLVEEEGKQAFVLNNIIEMVGRPETWLDDAEFSHLDEY